MQILVFRSEVFRPYLPDECQVNPNVLGFELAHWLSKELAARSTVTSYPGAEDWGWYLERTEGDSEYLICCSGTRAGDSCEWRVFVTRVAGFFGRRSHDARCDELLDLVSGIVADSGIEASIEPDV